MPIPVFFNIEHYTMPQLFYCDKANFFMGTAYGKGFMYQTFNTFYEEAYKKGVVKNRRKFKAKEFIVSEISYDEKHRIMCVTLPKPKKSDNIDNYLYSYYISFLEYKDKIEVLDIYGIAKHRSFGEHGFVISFSEDEDDIKFRGLIKIDKKSIVDYMYKVAFEDYYPNVDISVWK